MKSLFESRALLAGFASALVTAAALLGQTFYGSIVGTVTDATGAAAPGSGVALINLGTSERRAAETDAQGNYQFVNLVPGRYRIEVQAAVRIDATLEVGDVGQVVEVKADTPLLQTETSSLGQVVEARAVQQMPL